jgi:hypothetical protein
MLLSTLLSLSVEKVLAAGVEATLGRKCNEIGEKVGRGIK